MVTHKFTQAKSYTKGRPGAVTLVVIHTAECAEHPNAAENLAAWAAGPNAPRASWHYAVDSDSITQSVQEEDTAWHAGPVNPYSIGIEHAGTAKQNPAEWADVYSLEVLERSAELCAEICRRHKIPPVRLEGADLKAGKRLGITGHVDVTNGLTGGKGHWDPGPHFPWDYYLTRVRYHLAPDAAEMVTTPGKPEPVEVWDAKEMDLAAPKFPRIVHAGVEWLVCPVQVAPIGIGDAVDLAKKLGCELPTEGLVDAIWRAADLKINPWRIVNSGHDGTAKTMDSEAIHAETVRRLEASMGGSLGVDFRLMAGAFKDVVVRDGKIGLYGWHQPNGQPIQTFYGGHSLGWRDYSQGLRLIRRA